MRDSKTREEFIAYLMEHPEERFWQAVRNFSGWGFIYASNKLVDDKDIQDTFYVEADRERKQ